MEAATGFEEYVMIVDAGSVSEAARALGLPRASLSRRLSQLEERLGARLLHRSTRRLTLTRAGEELYKRARRIVEDARAAEQALRRLEDVPRGLLRVSSLPGVGTPPYQDLFLGFHRAFPEVELEVVVNTRHVDLVGEGFDVALRAGEVSDNALFTRLLYRDPWMVVGAPAYLERQGTPERPDDLADHNCLRGFVGGVTAARAWPLLNGGEIAVSGTLASNDLQLVRQGVLAGLGLALMPSFLIREDLAAERLEPVLEDSIGREAVISLVFAERRYQQPQARAFIDFISSNFDRIVR